MSNKRPSRTKSDADVASKEPNGSRKNTQSTADSSLATSLHAKQSSLATANTAGRSQPIQGNAWTPPGTFEKPEVIGEAKPFDREAYNLQRAFDGTGTTPKDVPQEVLDVLTAGGMPLRPPIRRELENRMDASFSEVRIHTGSKAAHAAEAINAKAFTCCNDVVFNSGEYDLDSPEGQHLLAHELAHVKQQTGAAISMMPQAGAELEIDPDQQLEREADEAAEQALSEGPVVINRMGTDVHIQRSIADHMPSVGGRGRYNDAPPQGTTTDTTEPAESEFAELEDGDLNETIASLVENQREIIGQLETSESDSSLRSTLSQAAGKGAIGVAGGLLGAAAGTVLSPGLGTASGAVAGQQVATELTKGVASDVAKAAYEPVHESGSKALAKQVGAFGGYIENLIDEKIKQRFGGKDYNDLNGVAQGRGS